MLNPAHGSMWAGFIFAFSWQMLLSGFAFLLAIYSTFSSFASREACGRAPRALSTS